jgi:hypothetical protein
MPCLPLAIGLLLSGPLAADPPTIRFEEVGARIGLEGIAAARLAVADVDADGRPDLIVSRRDVYLNRVDPASTYGLRFEHVKGALIGPGDDGVATYADLDGDGVVDAIAFRSVNREKAGQEAAAEGGAPMHAWWQRGLGDGTFAAPTRIDATRPATAAAIAVGDLDRDGRNDVVVGNWYTAYGASVEAFPADVLMNRAGGDGSLSFVRVPLPEDGAIFDEDRDAAGRPLYGAVVAELVQRSGPPRSDILLLAYGRRANRLYVQAADGSWRDRAAELGVDGDTERSGRYPEWLAERGKTDPRFAREDEKPFRAHGNTFDAAIGDVNGDGRFDLVLAEITHAWAGPSSDRSRVLLAEPSADEPGVRFKSPLEWSIDRVPAEGDEEASRRWNQGDLFAELVDLDHDGRLDLVLASGEYPDPAPFDERLRVFRQRPGPGSDGRIFEDVTASAGIDHPGCGQMAQADFDGDGRMDLVAGQSFNRFTPAMVAAAGGQPRLRLWLNRTGGDAPTPALTFRFVGETLPPGSPAARPVAHVPFGTTVTIDDGAGVQVRQLLGPGGHAGKVSEAIVHVGLGRGPARRVTVRWPDGVVQELGSLPAGRHRVLLRPPK